MRIRTRIILAVLPVVVAVNVFYAYYLVEKEREKALADLRTSIAETSRLLKVVVAAPLYDGDVEQLGTDLDSFFSDRHMIELVLEEYDGNLRLTRERQPAANLGTTLATRVVVTRGPDQLGEVRATYSTALIELDLQRSRNRIMFLAGLLVLLLSAVIYLVANGLTRRIDRLNLAARAIADGQLDQEVETGGARELVSLAESFVRMRDSIRAKMADLAEKNVLLRQQIAEREKLEGQLVQSQKMEAVGRLAGGIAHDFNNLLTVIIAHCEMILGEADLQPTLRADLEVIRQAGASAAALTRQLLAFSRKQVLQPRVLDLTALVGNMNRMLTRLIGEDVELVTRLGDGLWRVRADPGQMEQVVMNLAVNSRDAMPDGGRLTIETANVVLDDSYVGRHPDVRPGQYVLLQVGDTGKGMDAETLARVFEPFFTTKGRKGTGLGLSTVYGIVKQSGGHLSAQSEPGRGTTFQIYLPREESLQEREAVPVPVPVSEPHGETILVAEDSDGVRRLVRQVLTRCGYSVLEARNGEEALSVAERHPGPIRLTVTDVVMPGMGGRLMADRLKSARPEMRVLFMSGYTEDAIVTKGVLQGGIDFLAKPFTPFALEQKVKEILGSPVPGGVS